MKLNCNTYFVPFILVWIRTIYNFAQKLCNVRCWVVVNLGSNTFGNPISHQYALPSRFKVWKLDFQSNFEFFWFFGNFDFKTTFLLKSGLIFDDVANLGRASLDGHNQTFWKIRLPKMSLPMLMTCVESYKQKVHY